MTQFRERNPVPIGIFGLVLVVAVIALAFDATKFSFVPGSGSTYKAEFCDASSLQTNDDVRIAGIKIGHVSAVKLGTGIVSSCNNDTSPQTVVIVSMLIDHGVHINNQTTAAIKIKSLLGAMDVELDPGSGSTPLPRKTPITNTTTPLIVTTAFEHLTQNVESIDVNELAASFNVLSSDFSNTPSEVSSTLHGLSALSETISSRDAALQELLTNAQGVTTALASRDNEVTLLIQDGQTVLNLVTEQRDVIHALLINTSTLAQQIEGLVQENTAILGPALRNLQSTVDILTKDQKNLDEGIYLLAPYVRDFTDTLGNGEWFDTVIQNLSDAATPGCFTTEVTEGSTEIEAPTAVAANSAACS